MADNNCPFTATDQSAISPGQTWVRNAAGDGYEPGSAGGGAITAVDGGTATATGPANLDGGTA